MLLAHSYKPIICSHHKKAVIGAGGQQSEDCSPQVLLVAGQVSEGDNFGASLADLLP